MKKICVITATRADYGALREIILKIQEDQELELCLIVTGTHTSDKFGSTINEIYEDKFPIARVISLEYPDLSEGTIANVNGKLLIEVAIAFGEIKPDMLLIIGDRIELLPICTAATICGIPISHISGGEITEGAIDDSIRHAITKLSHIHFPACEQYKRRLLQMGEEENRVFNYGDPGVEVIEKMSFIEINELKKELDIPLDMSYAIVTYHPVTLERGMAREQINNLFDALEEFDDLFYIFTKSNSDNEAEIINSVIDCRTNKGKNFKVFYSLGSKRYLSLMKEAKIVIGNSSSGIVETPCFKIPTVNIGNRQAGRMMADSIISCDTDKESIACAIHKALSYEHMMKAQKTKNPYGGGDVAQSIVDEVKRFLDSDDKLIKHFVDR